MSLLDFVGLVGLWSQDGLILGIFWLYDAIQKYFQMEILSFFIQKNLMIPKCVIVYMWTLMIQRNSMIPKSLMIQREFQLEVWTLIIQKSTVIPPSSMVFVGCA